MAIEQVTTRNLEEVLPLIAAYQRFYQVETVDDDRNRAFFGQFARGHAPGVQFLYRSDEGRAVGFATLYFFYSSTSAEATAVMNDLYVSPTVRSGGVGRALILHVREHAAALGYRRILWMTATDNERAQRLYDSLPTTKSSWFEYELPTA